MSVCDLGWGASDLAPVWHFVDRLVDYSMVWLVVVVVVVVVVEY